MNERKTIIRISLVNFQIKNKKNRNNIIQQWSIIILLLNWILSKFKEELSYEYIKYIINTLYRNVTREESKKRRRKLGGGARFIEFHCIDLRRDHLASV